MHQGEESLAQPLYLCTSTSMKDIQGALRGQARRAVLETQGVICVYLYIKGIKIYKTFTRLKRCL